MKNIWKVWEKKTFNFSKATNDIVLINIKKLNTKKASQFYNVQTKYIKKFGEIFTPAVTDDYNSLTIGIFPEYFKTSEVIPTYNKDKPTEKLTTGPLVYFPVDLKFMRDLCMITWMITLMMFYQNSSTVSEKLLVPKVFCYIW